MIYARSSSGFIKWVLAFLIISWLATASAAYELNQLQWDTGTSGTITRDGVISYMGYSVTATDFNKPVESDARNRPVESVEAFVELNISKNGIFINKTMLGRGEAYISPDGEFKVTAVEFPASSGKEWLFESYAPWVRLELCPRGKPVFDLSVNMEDEYVSAPNTEIAVKVTVKNPGAADMLNVNLEVTAELPLLRGKSKFHYDKIQKGGQVSEIMTFSTPIITDLTKYDLYTNVSGIDLKDISYNRILLKTIFVVPPPQQMPVLKKSTNAKMYMKDYNMVSLSFKNTFNYELKNVSISDTIPKGFKQISNNSLNWLENVPPNGEWTARYILKATEADKDGIRFPVAKAEFKIKNEYYMIQSNQPETIVYGPRIELNKTTDLSQINPGETVTVTVIAVNKGSTPSKVRITDTVPGYVTFLSGTTTMEDYLEANKEVKFSYTIRSDSESAFSLPAAEADYFELGDKGAIISTKSQEPLITIRPPPTPEPTLGPEPVPTIEAEVKDLLGVNELEEDPWQAVDGNEQTIISNGQTNDVDYYNIPVVDGNEQAIIPEVVEQKPEKPSIDGNVILNVLLGCNNVIIDSQNNQIPEVCNLTNNVPFY